MERGLLDAIDVEVLQGLAENPPLEMTGPKKVQVTALHPYLSPDPLTGDHELWRDLDADLGEGKEVRESFTLPCWKDYRDLRFLAEGGLGRIFAATDPSLKRTVALKFLRRDDPDLVRRFVLEAQHQAKVDHPNICKVFEVGEWRGQAYIAMQFIQGETLETAAPRMSLAEKIGTMEIVAEAMNAAHRLGLIHRDIKPANIMIERSEGGHPKPYVLDFGLAKGMDASELTLHGMVIGTMHYMAPEQALGQFDKVGRRTDVYGLGATLFKIITGRLVFQGTESLDGVRRTGEEEPESLRAWVPDVPRDLETIVMKCLEKAPERRYESALALAEDLRRFREGEPILACPATWSYRIGKYVRKHKSLVAMSGVTLVSVLTMGGWTMATNLRARSISEFSTRFGTEAEGMATALRMAYLLPKHDVRPQKAKVRQRMEHIRQLIQGEGRLAEGPGAYALGRGHLALREFHEARRELEKAWAEGYRGPQVALALGQTLGELYREGLAELLQSSDLTQQKISKQALAKTFRDPALSYLKLGAGETPERKAYLEGLLAYLEEQYPLAIAKAEEAFLQEPTLYEAKILEGDARVAMGMARMDADPETFNRFLREAGEPYAVALNMARSDPALIHAEAARQCELARYAFFYRAKPRDNHCELQGLLDQALAVDPDAAQVYLTKARLATSYAYFQGCHGQDPFPVLEQALSWCNQATSMTKGRLFVSATKGDLYRWKAMCQRDRGLDPTRSLEQAFSSFQEAISLRPGDAWIHQRLADVCSIQSDLVCARGEDPQVLLDRGLFHTQEAFRLARSSVTAMCAANLYTTLGDWKRDHGQDPVPAFRQAVALFHQAISLSPNDGDYYAGLVGVSVMYAEHLRAIGEPWEDLLREGLAAAEKGVALAPAYFQLLNQGECLRMKAQSLLDRGDNPAATILKAEDSLRRAERLNATGDYYLYWYKGLLAMVAGEVEVFEKRSPEAAWDRADKQLARSTQINSSAPDPLISGVRLAWLHGKWLQSQRRPSHSVLSEGFARATMGFSLKPRQPELQALRGCLYQIQAASSQKATVRRQLLKLAELDLGTALAQNQFLFREFNPELVKVRALLARRGDQAAGKD
jgi:serine/threonine protein kinase